jgi:CRP/FNR family cyclic AMP-dependent transcriptional regulator
MFPKRTEHVYLLNGLSEQLCELARIGKTRKFLKGELVFRSGEIAEGVFFLKSGKVKVCHPLSSGKEINLWFCFGGEIFGFAEAAQKGERTVTAQACEDSEILSIPSANFNAFLFEHPKVMFLLLQVMSSRLRCLSETLANVAGERVQTRLARLILWLCAHYGKQDKNILELNILLTHQEIADMIGTTRQTVSSIINDFKRRGILEIHGCNIHILNQKLFFTLLH